VYARLCSNLLMSEALRNEQFGGTLAFTGRWLGGTLETLTKEDPMANPTQLEPSRPVGSESADFGTDHHHKPTKAVVGVAILVVLSFMFYEFGSKPAMHSSVATHQTVASANH
jgi:hypothetical protein